MQGTGNYRAKWHDYRAKSLYHITLMKSPDAPAFGSLSGNCSLPPGQSGSPFIAASPLGKIVKASLREMPEIHPALKVYQYALMPDHLHIILRVDYDMEEILGRMIGRFKNLVNKKSGLIGVFAEGFNDQIFTKRRDLNTVFKYLRENPYRLAVRRANPDFFTRRSDLLVEGAQCQAYGNMHLLECPFKEQVIVHRADSEGHFTMQKERWLYTAANGGVLVSPFISKREKEIRQAAIDLGARLIQISNEPLPERAKPAARDFELCAQGRLLIIAPAQPISFGRAACIKMNSMAHAITLQ